MNRRSLGKIHPHAPVRRIALTKPLSFSSSKESESESDSESEDSGSEWEESSSIDEGSTSDDSEPDGSSPARDDPQLGSRTTGKIKTTWIEEEEPAPRLKRKEAPISDEDLRAMALYQVEKGDGPEIHPYRRSRWSEFAQRPEVRRHRPRVYGVYGC